MPGIKSYKAEAVVEGCRIVKYGAADKQVVKGAAVGDSLIGISVQADTPINEQCDVIKLGPGEVRCGGAVTRGDKLTSDANGKAVTAAPGAGVNNNTIAIADESGVLDDIIQCTVVPGKVQG
jgi:hypothetical protein